MLLLCYPCSNHIFQWLISISFVLIAKFELTTNVILVGILLSTTTIALILFSFMPSLTYKRYTGTQNQTNVVFSLSHRYQMSENYRSAKLLTRVVWWLGGSTIVGSILYILKNLCSSYYVFLQVFYVVVLALHSIVYSCLIFCYEPKIQNFFLRNRVNV